MRKLDTAAIIAQGTETLRDDNRILLARKKALNVQIDQIDRSLNDRKQAAALIADKRDEIIALDQQVAENRKAIMEQGLTDRSEAFEAQVNLAEAEGNIPLQIKLINIRIGAINRLIAAGKKEGAALNDLKTERARLETNRESLQDQGLAAKTALGQSIFDLTGNKNPLLRALNAQIAETQRDINAAKKAGRSTVDLRTELNTYLLKRKEVLEDAKKENDKQGTTAFDLLSQFTATFKGPLGISSARISHSSVPRRSPRRSSRS